MSVEFSRPIRLDSIGGAARAMTIVAEASERAALARRFDLIAIDSLTAQVSLHAAPAGIRAAGKLAASVVQRCIASGEPVPQTVTEDFDLVFRPEPGAPASIDPDEEIDLDEGELDVVFYEGGSVDVGEAVAQTLALALDPYPRAPNARAALAAAGVKTEGEVVTGPFGGLAALRDKLGD